MIEKDYFQLLESPDKLTVTTEEIQLCLNELLDIYSLYLKTGISLIREEVIHKAFELHLKDPSFTFVV